MTIHTSQHPVEMPQGGPSFPASMSIILCQCPMNKSSSLILDFMRSEGLYNTNCPVCELFSLGLLGFLVGLCGGLGLFCGGGGLLGLLLLLRALLLRLSLLLLLLGLRRSSLLLLLFGPHLLLLVLIVLCFRSPLLRTAIKLRLCPLLN